MTPEMALSLGRQAIILAMLISAPILGLGLIVGILISILQAVTSIQEMTLTFIPKILAGAFGALVFGPWMLMMMMDFTIRLIKSIPMFAR
jgi:flagellar biosynthetic protein FliQ